MSTLFIVFVALAVIGLLKLGYFVWLNAKYPEPVLADEIHSVTTEDGWVVKLYRRKPASGDGEPIFLCHALATNHLNYEFPIGNSLVDALTEAGYECWTMDMRGDRNCPPPKGVRRSSATVDDYLHKDIPAALAFIREKTGYEQVHWVGHSMGGMLFSAYQAVYGGENIASATTFGAPIGFKDTRVRSGAPIAWLATVCPAVMSGAVRGLAPFSPLFRPQMPGLPINWDNLHEDMNPQAYFNLLEVPPGGVAKQMNRWAVTRDWKMNDGALDVPAELRKGTVPLLAFFAPLDPFVNMADAEDFMDNLPTDDKAMVVLSKEEGCAKDYNHCDIPFSPNADVEVFVHVIEWVQEHSIGKRTATAASRSARVSTAAKLAADALDFTRPSTPAAALVEEPKPKRKRMPSSTKPATKKASAKPKTKKASAKPKAKPKAKSKTNSAPKKPKAKATSQPKSASKKPASSSDTP
jgi:pimeloyl-ACP methyl ester carboxylesterase